jgi:hypothetical protein
MRPAWSYSKKVLRRYAKSVTVFPGCVSKPFKDVWFTVKRLATHQADVRLCLGCFPIIARWRRYYPIASQSLQASWVDGVRGRDRTTLVQQTSLPNMF